VTRPSPDELASIAIQLVSRVRDEKSEANGAWLREVLPDPEDRFRLCFVLAAAIPDNRPWLALTAWTVPRENPVDVDLEALDEGPVLRPAAKSAPWGRGPMPVEPCGTPAAARRHRRKNEDLCDACIQAERDQARPSNRAERSAA